MSEITVRKRGKKWEYRFEGAKIDGKRKQISKSGFSTKKEATMEAVKAYEQYNRGGEKLNPTETSVADYLDYWFDNYAKVECSLNTQQYYLSVIELHLKPALGMYRLNSLSTSVIQEFCNALKFKGFSKNHSKNIFCVLHCALEYAIQPLRYIQSNPANYVRFPKITKPPKERIILEKGQFEKIIERFPEGSRYYIPLMIGYYTGLRISEAFGLTWEDIDMENRVIHVQRQMTKKNFEKDPRQLYKETGKIKTASTWYLTDKLKTPTSNRYVKFGDTLYRALKAEKQRQLKNELLFGEYYNLNYAIPEPNNFNQNIVKIVGQQKNVKMQFPRLNLVCVAENGCLTSTDSFKYCSRSIKYDLKMKFDFHSLRHTHATRLIEAGASIKSVSERLGHAKIETTMNIYVHNTEKLEDETVELFEKAVK